MQKVSGHLWLKSIKRLTAPAMGGWDWTIFPRDLPMGLTLGCSSDSERSPKSFVQHFWKYLLLGMFSKFSKKFALGHSIVQELAPAPPVLQFANPSPPPGYIYVCDCHWSDSSQTNCNFWNWMIKGARLKTIYLGCSISWVQLYHQFWQDMIRYIWSFPSSFPCSEIMSRYLERFKRTASKLS